MTTPEEHQRYRAAILRHTDITGPQATAARRVMDEMGTPDTYSLVGGSLSLFHHIKDSLGRVHIWQICIDIDGTVTDNELKTRGQWMVSHDATHLVQS